MTATAPMTEQEWLAPGRKTIEGYLLVLRGPMKRDYGLFGNLVADIIDKDVRPGSIPRYRDCHAGGEGT